MKTFKTLATLSLSSALALSLTGCPTNPATGETQLILISERQEIQMGRQGAEQVRASIGLYQDEDLQQYVNDIGQQLAAKSERPDLPWSFQVVDDPVVNAFALPGGFIFMTRGILTHFNSEAEMAAVLGHEIGHVTGRHSAEQLSRAQFAQLGLGLGSIFVPEIGQYADVLSAGLGLMFLKFGRDDERQADDLGLRYMRAANYDPNEMVDVFTLLSRVSAASGGSRLPTWLSTHPDPENRRERILQAIQEMPPSGAEGKVQREAYLRHLDGVVYGENPRNGFFRGSLFQHPELEFQLAFPEGWKTQNMAQAVAGVSPEQDAIIQLTLSQAASPEAAAREFAGQQGVQVRGSSRRAINGLSAVWTAFTAQTQQGTLAGLIVYLSYQNRVYQLLGYTSAQRYGAYESTFERSIASFDRLTDRAALNVQPKRIELVTLDRAMTIERFAERHPSTIPTAELVLINGVQEGDRLPAGRPVKRVVGGDLPD